MLGVGLSRVARANRDTIRTTVGAATARCIALILLGASIVFACGCERIGSVPLEHSRLVVGATTLPASAPVYVAAKLGMFEAEGLDVRIRTYEAGRLALDDVLRGAIDIALVAETPIAKAVYDGKDPIVFATISHGDNVNFIVARRDRGIGEAHDLVGKRIGLLKGTSADFFLNIYLVASGIDPKSVEVVALEAGDLVSSLTEGRVDAISAFAPYTIDAQQRLGGNALVLDEPGLQATYWNAVTTRVTASQRRDTLTAFLRAIDKANRWVADNPGEAQRITAAGTRVPVDHVRRQWEGLHWIVSLDQSFILSLEDEYSWMARDSSTPDFLRHVDDAPLRAIDPMRVTIVDAGRE